MAIAGVEAKTKIQAKYLQALRPGVLRSARPHRFVKTFLRTYAEMLGLDQPHLLLDQYRAHHDAAPEVDAHGLAPAGRPQRQRRRAPGPPGRGTALALALAAVIALLLVLGLTGEGATTPRPIAPSRPSARSPRGRGNGRPDRGPPSFA